MKTKTNLFTAKRFHIFLKLTLIALLVFSMSTPVSAFCTRSSKFNKTYKATGNFAKDMVGVANKQLNRTKKDLGYTEAWCADFVLDCARVAGVPVSVIPYTTSSCCNCGSFYRLLTSKYGAKVKDYAQAKAGDLVFYYNKVNRTYVHVGLYAGSGTYIEGNMNGKVTRYTGLFTDGTGATTQNGKISRIYVRPNYGDISNATVKLSKTSVVYNGLAQKPAVTVKMNSKTLKSGTDYTISYSGNINAGTATVTIKGKGSYYGTAKAKFTIKKMDVNNLTIKLRTSSFTYDGKAVKPSVIVFGQNAKVTRASQLNTGYTLSYRNNNKPGTATVLIAGKGNFTGVKKLSYTIKMKTPTALTTKVSGKTINLKWNSSTGASGYEIQYRECGKKGWNIINTRVMNTSHPVRNLKALTTYEFRVRGYYESGSGVVYSNWSSSTTGKTSLF